MEFPTDPFDGALFGYETTDDGFRLWSSGPDGESGSDDDLVQVVGRAGSST